MKKRYYSFLLICVFFLFPFVVNAGDDSISTYYMDATVLENGDLRVREAFSLEGEYNGSERIIRYKNDEAATFNKKDSSYGGSSLHNGSGITLNQILGISKSDLNGNLLQTMTGDVFVNNVSASGYGEYRTTTDSSSETYRIYNPSSRNKAFYLDYTLQNMAIVHNDIAELGWNIFGQELSENIDTFELTIHIPGNKNELRAWAHGPLNGNIDLIDKETVKVTISDLKSNTAMDVRLAFDKTVVGSSTKLSNVEALPKILVYEQSKANQANLMRKQARFLYYGSWVIVVAWFIGLIIFITRTYLKYDKEYRAEFTGQYYREFPNTYGPEIVGFLMNKKVGPDDLSAMILNLVYKKVIAIEEIPTDKKKKDYYLIYKPENVTNENISTLEQTVLDWLFGSSIKDVKEEMKTKMSDFTKGAKTDYDGFLSSYDIWKNMAQKNGEAHNFYQEHNGRMGLIIYAVLGFILAMFTASILENAVVMVLIFVAAIGTIIYGGSFTKRTKQGNEDYAKWNAFKNFLKDFGNFTDKELPEIVLWEKYLVYAVTLGCASKLAKDMEVKATQYYPTYTGYYGYSYTDMLFFNHIVRSNVSNAVSSATSARTAALNSRNSSGGGYGGGFSSGGGSFGGGGGGGRF